MSQDAKTSPDLAPEYTANPTEHLLSRLERVRKCGRGWIARCPAHEDRTASLSVAAGEDGRVLLNCFGGCDAADVVAAVGLEMGDLFSRRPAESMTYAERSQLREFARHAQWRAALNMLGLESKILQIVGRQLRVGNPLNDSDTNRLALACQLIDAARGVLIGH